MRARRRPGAAYWCAGIFISMLLWAGLPTIAEEPSSPPVSPRVPPALNDDAQRLLELGQLLMGRNNPAYAKDQNKLSIAERNTAGDKALSTFRMVVKLEPKSSQAWLWLGIALTETLYYTKEVPRGHPQLTDSRITEGVNAFRTAYERDPVCEDCVKYYGDALIEYRRDFDGARKLWETYLTVATSDLQREMALVQAARACLNKAYFGKDAKMPADEVRQYYLAAQGYVDRAAKLCPNATDVKEMQALLQAHRKALCGK